ncbi:two-component system sensor histidine kinase NtrB [Phosphitispora sp. TUW77]|uniref:two-component system sensor histidine kinase NtrB n=1 Tax=Phosphitispora sp. TUW77 TaxID=3152361 RepID=UPI003AB19DD6
MLLKNDIKSKASITMPEMPQAILIADFSGKLKLAKWRLMSDGYKVYYFREMSEIEALLSQENIRVVLVSISAEDDCRFVEKIKSAKAGLGIVVVSEGKGLHIAKALHSIGIHNTAVFPVDYPWLSAVVAAELEQLNRKNRKKAVLKHNKRSLGLSQCNSVLYQRAFNHIKTKILILDTSGEIVLANRSMCNLLKLDAEMVIGKNFAEVLVNPEVPIQATLYELIKEIEAGKLKASEEILNNSAETEPVPYEVTAHRILNRKGKYLGVCIFATDIRDLKKLEKVIAHSDRMMVAGQLAAGAAHEIRNPLTSVKGFIQLLKEELEGTPKEEYISIIISEIDRVNNIISEFLKMAKPTILNKKEINIRDLLADIKVLVESEAYLKNINIIEDFPDFLPMLKIDCDQTKQVIINIIRNSFEAMSEGGTLIIKCNETKKRRELCIEIEDTGEGMTADTMKQMFAPFYTTKDSGTGLGLAVSREIVECHGGRIDVTSELGKGTKIRVYLPC